MSTVYKSKNSRRRYKGKHRAARKHTFLYISLGTLLAAAFTVGCAGAATPDAPPLNDSPAATAAAAPKGKPPAGLGDGQLKVGTDIQAGTYTTTVPADAFNCYWARLKAFDGELNSVIANGNLGVGAKGRIVVKKTDAGVEFTGGCRWIKAAK
jgi:hypothetical protein